MMVMIDDMDDKLMTNLLFLLIVKQSVQILEVEVKGKYKSVH